MDVCHRAANNSSQSLAVITTNFTQPTTVVHQVFLFL
jgi:hypothetical protein